MLSDNASSIARFYVAPAHRGWTYCSTLGIGDKRTRGTNSLGALMVAVLWISRSYGFRYTVSSSTCSVRLCDCRPAILTPIRWAFPTLTVSMPILGLYQHFLFSSTAYRRFSLPASRLLQKGSLVLSHRWYIVLEIGMILFLTFLLWTTFSSSRVLSFLPQYRHYPNGRPTWFSSTDQKWLKILRVSSLLVLFPRSSF